VKLLARESLIALDLEILVLLLIVVFYLNADIVTWFSILSFIMSTTWKWWLMVQSGKLSWYIIFLNHI